jgi:hypothetical protein
MPFGPDSPIGFAGNPLLGTVMGVDNDTSTEMEEYREKQKERELHLLGTMLFQALMLALCIVLYKEWTWSHFNSAYESAVFYGFAGFSVQAGFYFVYRAMFEDSASHRRQLKKMRSGNRRKMAGMKFQVEKSQQELMLKQQMMQFELMLSNSMADGVIDNNEDALLQNQMATIQNLINQMKVPKVAQPQQQVSLDPKALGMDRHRVMGVPVGPSLVPQYNMQPVASAPVIPQEQTSTIPTQQTQSNLVPSGAENILHSE